VLEEADGLVRHPFARHVMEQALEYGRDEWRCKIAGALLQDVPGFARHRHASHTVESALLHCSGEYQSALVSSIVGAPGGAAALARSQSGAFVVTTLLRLPGDGPRAAWGQIVAAAPQLQDTKHGAQLLRDTGLLAATAAAAAA